MASKENPSRPTPLQRAIERGMKPGGDLDKEIQQLGDYPISSKVDAAAICDTLERLLPNGSGLGGDNAFYTLVVLFQNIESSEAPAFEVLTERGIELVAQVVDQALKDPSLLEDNTVFLALKILAMYGTAEGTDRVIEAVNQPFHPEGFMWSVVLRPYASGHPESERFFEEISDPLPGDFLAISLLDAVNGALIEGGEFPHPFNTPTGTKMLEAWLTGDDESYFSYAVSATSALPFIEGPEQNRLLAFAFDHPSKDVQLEAAWVAARLGRDSGIRWLSRSCLDVAVSERAKEYLRELERPDAIPPESEEPSFQAKATFAQWLAHPSELGRAPDRLEIVDHRDLFWPPEREEKPVWLIQYQAVDSTGLDKDDIDVGLVGSVTFCLFGYKLGQRPPEDAYAIHCFWEMEYRELIAETEVEKGSTEYLPLLRQCEVEDLEDVQFLRVIEPSPDLQYPQTVVALASATCVGEPGWVVIDGPRSRWYAEAEMPTEVPDKTVLMVHVGRVLLGFTEEPNRYQYLQEEPPPRSPQEIVEAYERHLNEAGEDTKLARKYLTQLVPFGAAFDDYVAARAALRSESPAACTCATYETLLRLGEKAAMKPKDLYHGFAPLAGEPFDRYVKALIELNRQSEVPALLDKFRPFWDHNMGYAKLGTVAFQSGHDELAEVEFEKLRTSLENAVRCEEMGYLAEIWKRQGRDTEARALLIDCLNGVYQQSREATGSDRDLFEGWYQNHLATFRKLFPEQGDAELQRLGVPTSTLSPSDLNP